MKRNHWIALGLLVVSLVAGTNLTAQQLYVRGSFNGWDTSTPMTDQGGGLLAATITGTAGTRFDFKVANADWSSGWPGDNCRTLFNSSGSATIYYRAGSFSDGWNPTANRVGYADPAQFGWEVMGSFNGWGSPVTSLTPVGVGVYSANYLVPTAGSYSFKFREANSWDVSIGLDFRNNGGDCGVITTADNQLVNFQLDLPNGRWSAAVVPEPSSLSLLAGGALLLLIRRRA
jgi:hypothetical protein